MFTVAQYRGKFVVKQGGFDVSKRGLPMYVIKKTREGEVVVFHYEDEEGCKEFFTFDHLEEAVGLKNRLQRKQEEAFQKSREMKSTRERIIQRTVTLTALIGLGFVLGFIVGMVME